MKKMISKLIDAGSDVNARNKKGETALMCMIEHCDINNLTPYQSLINAGADVNAKDKNGVSVLKYAKLKDNRGLLVEYLKRKGAQ